ncbi:MAG TPA: thiamine diphosphokinase, partial [Ktedonobacteraceae bacterium]
MHGVIFAGGELRQGSVVKQALSTADLIIAADSGALTALRHGYVPAIVVGDFDSLSLPLQELEARGCELIRAPVEKNETDCELAIQVALERGADTITLLGGIGGARFDHTLANVFLMVSFPTVPVRMVDGAMTCWLLRGPGKTSLDGQVGDLVSLFPMAGDARGIKTHHLYYPLHNETLYIGKARGISNA